MTSSESIMHASGSILQAIDAVHQDDRETVRRQLHAAIAYLADAVTPYETHPDLIEPGRDPDPDAQVQPDPDHPAFIWCPTAAESRN